MSEDMPEDMPDHMPEDMLDRMPNRMSEDMSDRMPEDLPVRKCINVMVGITRSKVIKKGLIRHLFFWKALHLKALTQIWLSKVNGPALFKERWRRFLISSTPKVVGHNGVPSKHSYY